MIIIYHHNNKVVEVLFNGESIPFSKKNIAENVFDTAEKYPDQLIMWCQLDLKLNLNHAALPDIFHHDKIMASFNVSADYFLPKTIGYVDESPFLNVKKDVSYPTWQMSADIGGVHAKVVNALQNKVSLDTDFDYFLHSLAKGAMPNGLLCYSEPSLIKDHSQIIQKKKRTNFLVFRFVKQHYRTRWIFLLFLDLFLYERKFALFPLLASLFFKRRIFEKNLLDKIEVHSVKKVIDKKTIDVIIPTIGRKECLYDVLKDLSKQTHLPVSVIIIEQNPASGSTSELDYLQTENWPFTIKHTFTHQAGACNARNLALAQVESEWVFLNDDDNRFESDLIEKTFANIESFGCLAALTFYPVAGQKLVEKKICQAAIFGSGNSFIKSTALEKVSFNKSLEFGYGEDTEFGLQLRNAGFDIIYFPNLVINHLKAPMGGFRTKPVLIWQNAEVQPKPSPTIMFLKLNNLSIQQLNGYKTVLCIKFYKAQHLRNPVRYLLNFSKQWKSSIFWAQKLKE